MRLKCKKIISQKHILLFLLYSVPIHVRQVVYNYHFQNTYDIRDWDVVFLNYEAAQDPQEQERLLQALTFSRIPSQLARYCLIQIKMHIKTILKP